MSFPEIVDVARNFAVMIRIQGADPKGVKMRKHAFHLYNSGKTTLSASGMVLPGYTWGNQEQWSQNSMLVLTVASVIEPFLSQQNRENTTDNLQLVPGVQIDVMAEGGKVDENNFSFVKTQAPCWRPAELLAVVNIPVAAEAVKSILKTSGSLEYGWEVGWSLASYADGEQSINDTIKSQVENFSFGDQRDMVVTEMSDPNLLSKATTRIALLRVPLEVSEGFKKLNVSPSSKRGDVLLAMGSPFGILSPVHFFNSIAVGSVANCYQPNSSVTSLLMADIRCLPGMEGAPIFGDHSQFIGILIRPLRQRISGAEVQMIMRWDAILCAIKDVIQDGTQTSQHLDSDDGMLDSRQTKSRKMLHSDGSSSLCTEHLDTLLPSSVEKAMSAICLITTGDGAWASGVLLNSDGLILTNAHLLEPWRFRKEATYGDKRKSRSAVSLIPSSENIFLRHDSLSGLTSHDMKSREHETAHISLGECKESRFSFSGRGSQRSIQVRLDFKKPWAWVDAKVVYISKGPLDVALLKLESIPDQLIPINIDFRSPAAGSEVYVVGHGLFGPRYDFLPSASLGVIAKVVEAKKLQSQKSTPELRTQGAFPVMLETTAAVHPGGSGGAVINGDGYMIGLVTSNARHGGGMVIPHLNFSIPCAALEPIFRYSRDMQELSVLHDLDRPNDDISTIWALKPAVSPKPSPDLSKLPSFPGGDDKNGKGSRFSKFLTELGDLGSGPNKLLPSKL